MLAVDETQATNDVNASRRALVPVALLLALQQAMFLPIVPLYARAELGLSAGALTLLLLALHTSGLAANLLVPFLLRSSSDAGRVFVIAAIGSAFGYAAYAGAGSAAALIAITALVLGPASCQNAIFFGHLAHTGLGPSRLIETRGYFALAWVAGPPCALLVVESHGYSAIFYALLACALLTAFAGRGIAGKRPSGPASEARENLALPGPAGRRLATAFAIVSVLQGVNILSIALLPLVILEEIGAPLRSIGISFALCAGFELAAFLLLARLSRSVDIRWLLVLGCLSGVTYHLVLALATNVLAVHLAQSLNAVFIAALMGVGMVWFQSLANSLPTVGAGTFVAATRAGALLTLPLMGLVGRGGFDYQSIALVSALALLSATVAIAHLRFAENRSIGK